MFEALPGPSERRRLAAVRVRAERLATLLLLCSLPSPLAAAAIRVKIDPTQVAVRSDQEELYLEALPEPGEGWLKLARRLSGTSQHAAQIARENGGGKRLLAGARYRVSFDLLSADLQLRVVRALFPGDRALAVGWEHRIIARPRQRESLWRIAEWFTGRGHNYRAVREANRLVDDDLLPGQTILIPAELLRPGLRAVLPPSSSHELAYGADERGQFAVYRLKPGEALYSSVVVRFTGRVYADDVKAVAAQVASRSDIRDVTAIPVDYEVKIPFDLLLPEFLPVGHARRQEYEQELLASARYSNRVRAKRLEGVTVVLDAGHGGKDVGASQGGIWESLYVYDIMLRCRSLLEETTSARVIATTQDGVSLRTPQRDRLPYSNGHRVLTTPNYLIEDATVGVHLRWYLVNSIFRRKVSNGGEADKVVFISLHADSLHHSLRGAMTYIPGARYRGGTYGKTGTVYASRKEVRERPKVSFSRGELVKSEGLSRDLAKHILKAFDDMGLAVHQDKPIRERIIRHRRAWVPAVLRYNEVPAKLLLEVCNLANAEDRQLIQTHGFRQRVAEAIVRGILDYYGYEDSPAEAQLAATSG